jgi:hypothetical protein
VDDPVFEFDWDAAVGEAVPAQSSINVYSPNEQQFPPICRKNSRCWRKGCDFCARAITRLGRSKIVGRQPNTLRYHLTLSPAYRDGGLRDLLDRLSSEFAKLRQRRIWTRNVIGGAYSVHLVGKERPNRWRPHVHVLVSPVISEDRTFEGLPWRDHWRDITGDSDQVEAVPHEWNDDAEWLLPNYILRPPHALFKDDPAMMTEYRAATKSRRPYEFLGSWRDEAVMGDGIPEEVIAGERMLVKAPAAGSTYIRSPKRRKSGRAKWEEKKAAFVAAHPTPYEGWADVSEGQCLLVREKLAGADPGPWTKGGKDRIRALTVADLAVGLWAVECRDGMGMNYGQVAAAFKRCLGVGCHRAKAAAVLARLVALGLIVKVGNYSVGGRGNVYRVCRESEAEWDA